MKLHDETDELPDNFDQEVYKQVALIPFGKVATYGQIAELAGYASAAREVGHIMSRVQTWQDLPCHRVVNKTGTLSPDYAFGGKDKQQALLEKEGITFSPDGRINMERHLWGGVEQLPLF